MSFKLLAIRPLVGCDNKYLKNLTAGEVYNLCNEYEFLNKDGKAVNTNDKVFKIRYKQAIPDNFYSITKINGDVIDINISAIVGRNGSGKSSLIDLFLYSIFVVSNKLNFVQPVNFIELDSKNSEKDETIAYNKELKQIESSLKVEIYYYLNDKYYRLRIDRGDFKLESSLMKADDSKFGIGRFGIEVITLKNYHEEFKNFFYSIVVNYSLYAYNSNVNGIWLKSFFHKNDGYQMPIVINPFRKNGNVDINSETLLTRSRLLSNILSISKYKNINNKSPIDKIELFYNRDKKYKFLKDGKQRFSKSFIENFRLQILVPLFNMFFNDSFTYPTVKTPIQEYAEIYLINKIITIPTKYESYKGFDKRFAKAKERPDNYKFINRKVREYVNELYQDRSHITLKVRQTLNFLREDIYNLPSTIESESSFDLNSMVRIMNELKRKDWFTELIDYLPPPFLFSKIRFKDGSYFEDLSSGEKQKIYSLNSIIYHLKNLESINKNWERNKVKKIIAYDSVNLIFDEVELYYHPQFQKETISSLLYFIRIANLKYIRNINIIFLTHSPFILSDIPIQNTALLDIDKKTGKTKLVKNKKQSLGANIHDLLADNFFLTDTLVGNFADNKIMQLIKKIKISPVTNNEKRVLKLVGDTFLKSSIEQFIKSNDKD